MAKKNLIILLILIVLVSGCNDGYGDYRIINGYNLEFRPIDIVNIRLISMTGNSIEKLAFNDRYIYLKTPEEDYFIIDALERKKVKLLIKSELLFEKMVESKRLVLETPEELIKNQTVTRYEDVYYLIFDIVMYEGSVGGYVISCNYLLYKEYDTMKYIIPNKVIKVEYDERYIFAEQKVSEKLYIGEDNPDYESEIGKINYWYIDTHTREKYGPYTKQEINDIKKELNLSNLTVEYPDYDKTY